MRVATKRMLIFLLLCSGWTQADYVTDRVDANLFDTLAADQAPIGTVSSGTPVRVVQRENNWARVETVDGRVGWVETRWLTEQPTAEVRLLALQGDYRQSQDALNQAQTELAQLRKQLETLHPTAAAAAGTGSQSTAIPWSIWTGLMVFVWVIGLILGRYLEDRKLRKLRNRNRLI